MKRLLFLCQTLPFPPDGGAHIRSFHLLRALASDFEISALFFFRRRTRPTREAVEDSLAGLRQFCHPEAFPIPQEQSRRRLLWDHLRSTSTRRAYTVFAYESAAYRRRLRELLGSGSFDVVHVDSLDLSAYLPDLRGLSVVCGHHNVESALLARRAGMEPTKARRTYLGYQAGLMAREEARWCPRVAANLTCSAIDSDLLREIAPRSEIVEIPNGVDVGYFHPQTRPTSGIVFVGGHSWFPNRDGMEWFAREVLPLVRQRRPGVEMTWVGRIPPEVEGRYRDEFGIHATGYVEDVRPYIAGARCVVVPIRVGGGTRLKVLDAWAMGRPMVSTTIGCEGLKAVDGENLFIRDSVADFADAIETLLADETLGDSLGASGRLLAEQRYSWDVIGDRLRALYGDL